MSDDYSFVIEHLECTQATNMPEMHSHTCFEIYYQMSGGKNYFIEDKFYSTKKGDVLILAPGTKHKTTYAGVKSYHRFCVYFKPDFLSDFSQLVKLKLLKDIDKYAIIELGSNEREKIEFLLFNMLEEFNTHPENYILNLELMMKELIVRLDRCHYSTEIDKNYSPNMYRVISDICLYIQMNYKQDITLENLAENFKLSPFYLSRKFKEITKYSIPQYINNIRLEFSKELLKNTNFTITKIATQIGYGNSSHFARVFKNYLGSTPRQYRKKHGLKN